MTTIPSLLTWALVLGAIPGLNPSATAQTTNNMPGRTVVKLLPDYHRARVYALNSGATTAGIGSLIALDAADGSAQSEITLGTTPTDMDIDPGGQYLFVIHIGNDTISRVNLDTFSVDLTRSFPPQNNSGDHYNLKCGVSNRVYWLDAMWAPALHIMDFATGNEVGSYDSGEGFGDLVLSPDKRQVFTWRQYGWSAGSGNSWIWRLALSNDVVSIQDTSTAGFGRDPLDSPILISGTGDRVFRNQYVLYTTNLASVAQMIPNSDVIYNISYFGDVAFSSTKAYNARNGGVVFTLPFATSVQAISGDQQRLFLFNPTLRQLVTIPMNQVAPVPSATMTPTPADNAILSLPLTQLSWTWPPGALSFDVYFGTNQAAVAAATTNSPLYRGQLVAASLPLINAVVAGATYYWRVDPIGLSTTLTGAVWRFQTASGLVAPLNVAVTTVASFNAANQTLTITSAGGPLSWALSENIPWLSANLTSGTTPAAVTLSFQSAALAAGTYTGSIQLSVGGSPLTVAVTLEVVDLDLAKMVTDFQRPYIYALQRSPAAGKPGAVLFLNTDTDQIERALPIVTDPRDLCVHPRENKLYIVDWLSGYLRVVDLVSQTPLPPLAVYIGLDRVNPGRAGRVIMEDWNQWIGVFAIDTTVTTNGIQPQLAFLREGDGEVSPDGRYYYHCDNNISSASASKWDLVNDSFAQIGGSSTAHPYGSRLLYLSPDGSRLFWQGFMYNTTLTGPSANTMLELAGFGQQIYASTSNAWFAVGDSSVFDTRTASAIHSLGFSTGVKALSRDDTKLYSYNSTTRKLVVTPMATVLAPKITGSPTAQSVTVGATVNFSATGQGAWPLTYQWLFNDEPLPGATNLNLTFVNVQTSQAGSYSMRISSPYGAVTSAVASLTVLVPPGIVQEPQPLTVLAGMTAAFSVTAVGTAPLSFQWQRDGANIPGATSSTLVISNVQYTHGASYRVFVQNSVGNLYSTGATLVVLSPPLILQQPAPVAVRPGSNAQFSITAVGTPALTYQWQFETADVPGATNTSLNLSNVSVPMMGNYRAVIHNDYGFTTSSVANLTVLLAPIITQSPTNLSVRAGSNALFFVSASGTAPLRYQWQLEGVNIVSATNNVLSLTNVQPIHAGAYRVVVTNLAGSATSATALLRVLPGAIPAHFTQLPASRFVALGESAAFAVGIDGTPPLSVQWQFNGTNLPGATDTILAIAHAVTAQSGLYRVVVSNPYGNASATATLVVLPQGGQIIAWGDDTAGQSAAPAFGDVVRVAGGNFHSLALRASGVVVGWGDNALGQSTPPTTLSNVVNIAAGDGFSLALRSDGTVAAWGDNSSGQTNVPPSATNAIALSAGQAHAVALRANGTAIAWGNNAFGQTLTPPNNDLTAVAAGEIHTLALRANGQVVGWGNNTYGQAMPPAGLSNVIAVSAGYLHSLALRADGSVVAWGDNTFGQSAVPAELTNVIAVVAGEIHSTALRADGSIVGWGDNTYGETTVPVQAAHAVAVASGYYHQLAIVPRPVLQFGPTPEGLRLWWNGAYTLQRASSPAGPFGNVTAASPWTNRWQSPDNSFFRLQRLP